MSQSNSAVCDFKIRCKFKFKNPMAKYDFTNTNRQQKNEQLTDYFNYGFNEDTMNIYSKIIKNRIKATEKQNNNQYFQRKSNLLRLKDQIPMDFGGFQPFYHTNLGKSIDNEIQKGDSLMEYFVLSHLIPFAPQSRQKYSLVQFIKMMQPPSQTNKHESDLHEIVEQIIINISDEYDEMMGKQINNQKQLQNICGVIRSLDLNRQSMIKQSQQFRPKKKVKLQKQEYLNIHMKQKLIQQKSPSTSPNQRLIEENIKQMLIVKKKLSQSVSLDKDQQISDSYQIKKRQTNNKKKYYRYRSSQSSVESRSRSRNNKISKRKNFKKRKQSSKKHKKHKSHKKKDKRKKKQKD